VKYVKLSGSGNTFVLIDNLNGKELNIKELALSLCKKENTDGLLILELSDKADFKMRVFNKDASEAEMCGNGARCCAFYFGEKEVKIETLSGIITAYTTDDKVKIMVGEPKDIKLNIPIYENCHFVRVGVPHTVIIVDDLKNIDICKEGRKIRFHHFFGPSGTNVNFVRVLSKDSLKIRTYERGVEGETLSCGTGSSSASYISFVLKKTVFPTFVKTRSGEILSVYFVDNKLYLEGKVHILK